MQPQKRVESNAPICLASARAMIEDQKRPGRLFITPAVFVDAGGLLHCRRRFRLGLSRFLLGLFRLGRGAAE